MQPWNLRRFLKISGLLGGSLLTSAIPFHQISNAQTVRMDVPAVDEVTIREITDNAHDVTLQPLDVPGLTVKRTGFPGVSQGKTRKASGVLRCIWSPARAMRRGVFCMILVSRRTFMPTISIC